MVYTGSAPRIKAHLLNITGQGIQVCPVDIPDDVIIKLGGDPHAIRAAKRARVEIQVAAPSTIVLHKRHHKRRIYHHHLPLLLKLQSHPLPVVPLQMLLPQACRLQIHQRGIFNKVGPKSSMRMQDGGFGNFSLNAMCLSTRHASRHFLV